MAAPCQGFCGRALWADNVEGGGALAHGSALAVVASLLMKVLLRWEQADR